MWTAGSYYHLAQIEMLLGQLEEARASGEMALALAADDALALYTQPLTIPTTLPLPGAPDALASGDLDGDRVDEIVTGPGPGANFGAQVRGWDTGNGSIEPIEGMSFFAYDVYEYRYGVRVGVGHFFY